MRIRLATVLLLGMSAVAVAQRVSGTVRATGTQWPMSEVTVTVLDSVGAAIAQTQTNREGRYDLALKSDAMHVRATRIGYRPVVLAVSPGRGDLTMDIVMDVLRELDTVVTTAAEQRYSVPRLQDFERRRLSGMGGHFISEDELRTHDSRSLADVIRSYVPGVKLVADRSQLLLASTSAPFMNGPTPSGNRPRAPSACWVTVYMDGMMIYQGGEPPKDGRGVSFPPEPPPDLKQFFAMNLSGVEYYSAAMTPLQYKNIRNPCGTLLLWTRGK